MVKYKKANLAFGIILIVFIFLFAKFMGLANVNPENIYKTSFKEFELRCIYSGKGLGFTDGVISGCVPGCQYAKRARYTAVASNQGSYFEISTSVRQAGGNAGSQGITCHIDNLDLSNVKRVTLDIQGSTVGSGCAETGGSNTLFVNDYVKVQNLKTNGCNGMGISQQINQLTFSKVDSGWLIHDPTGLQRMTYADTIKFGVSSQLSQHGKAGNAEAKLTLKNIRVEYEDNVVDRVDEDNKEVKKFWLGQFFDYIMMLFYKFIGVFGGSK